jgi:hypothetical protein
VCPEAQEDQAVMGNQALLCVHFLKSHFSVSVKAWDAYFGLDLNMCVCVYVYIYYILSGIYQILTNVIVFLTREVKEKVAAQVLLGHLVPEVSLVSWVSQVLKEMM